MTYKYVLIFITAFILTITFAILGLPILKKIKIGQPILHYVKEHESKNGTPTMGGVFFMLSLLVSYILFFYHGVISNAVILVSFGFFVVGFLDDFLKIKSKNNLGLKPYQKIIFQLLISIFLAVFAYLKGITNLTIPFINTKINLGFFSVPFYVFILIAITNAVNLTDGLDGLASSATRIYIILFIILLFLQKASFESFLKNQEFNSLIMLNFAMLGALSAFLLFNFNKASVFMGDTGSLSLGGYVGTISILTENSFYILFFGVAYVLSAVSVVIQVLYFKKTKKRIFLMAPYHHHLQKKGYSEGKICYFYSLFTCIIGGLVLISYF